MDTTRPSNVVRLRAAAPQRHPASGNRDFLDSLADEGRTRGCELRNASPVDMVADLVCGIADLLWLEDDTVMLGEEPLDLNPATVDWLRQAAGF